ncbi:MAG: hypothetical protein AB7T06_40770 [Kofleriaceae bacterium]
MSDSEPSTPLEELPLGEQISRLVKAQIALAGVKHVDVERAIGISHNAAARRWIGETRWRADELDRIATWLGIDRELLLPDSMRPEGGWTYWQAAEIFEQ